MIKIFYCSSANTDIPTEISEYRYKKIFAAKKGRQQMINAATVLKAGFASFGINERDVIYGFGENGKPFATNFPGVHFSLAHSDNFTIVAFYDKALGIDCENSTRNISPEIINRFFSERESEDFCNAPIRLWTAKEAFVKYTGKGFATGRNELEIPYFGGEIFANGVWLKHLTIDGYECTLCTSEPDQAEINKVL